MVRPYSYHHSSVDVVLLKSKIGTYFCDVLTSSRQNTFRGSNQGGSLLNSTFGFNVERSLILGVVNQHHSRIIASRHAYQST